MTQPEQPEQPQETAPAHDRRPVPEYGEYAPEGWEWKPEPSGDEDHAPTAVSQPGVNPPATPAAPNARAHGTAPLTGVPHNLGAGSALPSKQAARTGQAHRGDGSPYQGSPQEPRQRAAQHGGTTPGGVAGAAPGVGAARPRPVDRVITIVLLVIGAFGALQTGAGLFSFGTTFQIMFADALGAENVAVPEWLPLTGKIAGVALLALYAVTLIYSIRRLRAGKLTFWVPLTAGIISVLTIIIISTAAIFSSPELMQLASDPTAASQLLEQLQEQQSK